MESIVKIDPKAYGLEESKAKEVSAMFKPMLDKMEDLEEEFNTVLGLEITPEATEKAKELRLKYVKVRTGTAAIHKELKAFYLLGGRFVDGWKNAQLLASQGKEEALYKIENYIALQEKAKADELFTERETLLNKYGVNVIPRDLGYMPPEIWNNYYSGVKANYKAEIEAEKKAKRDRIAKEKKAKEDRRKLKEAQAKIDEQLAEERKLIEAKELSDKKAQEAQDLAEKAVKDAQDLLDKAEREAEEREAKRKADQITAEKAEADEKERLLQVELNKGDAAKMLDLSGDLTELKTKYAFKSAKNKKLYTEVSELLDKIINYMYKNE